MLEDLTVAHPLLGGKAHQMCIRDRQGSEGGTVRLVQQKLRGEGETLTADGKYGAKTTEAVRRYQKRNSLTADGSVGSATWEKMF